MDGDLEIRPWRVGDELLVRQMLDPDLDPVWVAQAQALHGPELKFPAMRHTRLAICDGTLAGIGTIVVNPIHPGRYSSAIEVRPEYRRRQIGSRLLTTLLDLRPEPFPLATKINASNAAAKAFAQYSSASTYQECPGLSIDLTLPSIRKWIDEKFASTSTNAVRCNGIDEALIVESFVEQYVWVHEHWSPVGSLDALRRTAGSICREVDPELSSFLEQNGRIDAGVYVFRDGDAAEIVAETTRRDLANGWELLANTIATSLRACCEAGIRRVEFDGHVTDPHLFPILESMPDQCRNPLLLVEFS